MTTTPLSPHLNEALVHRALIVYHSENNNNKTALRVKTYAFKLSSVSGENYCSDIYIVEVQYELDGNDLDNSFIVKIMLPQMAKIPSNEGNIYSPVLPGMEECLRETNVQGGGYKLHARCLVSERNGHEFYVLENLNTLGYFCADRVKGLDEAHGRTLMNKIGKFHAASMLYAKKYPDFMTGLNKSHFEHGASDFMAEAITFGGLQYISDMIESWPGYEHLAPKVKNIIPRFNDLVKQVVNPENAIFKVLNHGDLWVNNLLYKPDKDTNEPVDVLFVDFQQCFWGGCGFDLNWFFNTSLQLNVLKEKRIELLKSYYVSLRSTLEATSYPEKDIPSWDQVLLEVNRNELIGLYSSLCELPIVALVKSVSKDFTLDCYLDASKMQNLRDFMYANERVKETLMYTLKYYEEIGILV